MLRNDKNSIFGKLMMMEGGVLLVPLLVLFFYTKEIGLAWMFIVPGGISIILGAILCMVKKVDGVVNSNRVVVGAWMYGFFLAAIPFYLYGNVNFMQALFESVSGYTTTGLSVLDVYHTPKIFLFYRSFLQYVGGLGFVMMMLVFVQGKHAVNLYEAEGHPDRLMPNIGKTAKVIFKMYSFFLVIGTIVYVIFGMSFFDSIVHTMCALSTGGFSNHLASIGYYDSVSIEIITIILMLIGTTNFFLLLLLFRKDRVKFLRASETRFLAGLCLIFVPITAFFLNQGGWSIGKSIRQASFNAISALSTTGYGTSDYSTWPELATIMMIILMLIGGGIGSTAGGIKLGRVCIVLKNLWKNIKKKIVTDRNIILCHYNRGTDDEILSDKQIEEASTYLQIYMLIFLVGSVLLTYFAKCNFLEGAFEFASSLGTVGLSIGVTNMELSSLCLFIEIVGMVLGRLEIFVIIKVLVERKKTVVM